MGTGGTADLPLLSTPPLGTAETMAMNSWRERARVWRSRKCGIARAASVLNLPHADHQLGTSPIRGFLFMGLVYGWALLWPALVRGDQFVEMDFNIPLNSRARGTVFIELFDDRPLTRDNFLAYVNSGNYDATLMHRLAFSNSTPFVLQGGGYYLQYQNEPAPLNVSLNPNAVVDLDGNPATPNPTVNNEFNNLPFRSNLKGTIAMAKLPGDPNSATSQYFFNLSNNSAILDGQNGGFTVFAQVVGDGMNLIDAYDGLTLMSLDQDADDNGVRDNGPFGTVPVIVDSKTQRFLPLMLNRAKAVDYYGSARTTDTTGGLTLTAANSYIDTGATFTGTGSVTIDVGKRLGIREGYTLSHDLISHGTLAPGLQLGTVTVANYFQWVDGNLEIQLHNTTADTEYDRLVVAGSAFLAGKLSISLLNGYNPVAGSTYTVLTAGSITGAFDTFGLPQLSPGLVWSIGRTSTAYTLAVAAADYNQNGVVDAADYLIWRHNRGMASGATVAQGDSNGDGAVNDADYLIWRANLGNVRGTASGTGSANLGPSGVPEPGISALMLVLLTGLPMSRYRRKCLRSVDTTEPFVRQTL